MNITDIFTPEVTATIAQAVIAIVGALLTALVGFVIRFVRVHTTAEQFSFIQNTAAIAVSAAEQMGLNGLVEDKKSVALAIVERELAARGIKVTAAQLDAAIEAAVLDGFNAGRAVEPTVDADIVQPEPGITGLAYGSDFSRSGY